LTCTLFSDSVSKAMNSNMVGRRIHKPMEGKSFKEGSWNDYHLYTQPTKIGWQQESDRSGERGQLQKVTHTWWLDIWATISTVPHKRCGTAVNVPNGRM
jgi:hypothetical protein